MAKKSKSKKEPETTASAVKAGLPSVPDKNVSVKYKKEAIDFKDELQKAKKLIECTIVRQNPPEGEKYIDISQAYNASRGNIPDYVTVDIDHLVALQAIIDNIEVYANDAKARRPLNILLEAGPGSGKSHLVKCLARELKAKHVKHVPFNMAAVEGIDDFTPPLEEVRNLKVNDQLPLLFLDEFDCRDRNIEILLPLLWDGELQLQNRHLKVGKIVTVLAGSTAKVHSAVRHAKGLGDNVSGDLGKLGDLLSRINGGILTIPKLESAKRRADKVCIVISLLERRFAQLGVVPWCLLSFIALTRFRYGVRSIEYFLDCITGIDYSNKELFMKDLENLPIVSLPVLKERNFGCHLFTEDEEELAAVVNLWGQLKQYPHRVRIRQDFDTSAFSQRPRLLRLIRKFGI